MTTSTTEAFKPQPDCSYTIWGDDNSRVGNDPAKIAASTSIHDTPNGLRARISKLPGVDTLYKASNHGRGDKVFYTATDPKAICGLINAVIKEPSRDILSYISSTLSHATCRTDKMNKVAWISPSFTIPSTPDGLMQRTEIPVSKITVWHDTYVPWNVVAGPRSQLGINVTPYNDKSSTTTYTTDVAVPKVYTKLS
jgi:hypothetical protein